MRWITAVLRTVCVITTAMVWIVMNIVAWHYLVTFGLSGYSRVVLTIAFPISALSGAGYLVYWWICNLRKRATK